MPKKTLLDIAYFSSIYFLLGWYVFSLYLITQDDTMNLGMKLAYEMINCLTIMMIARVLTRGYRFPTLLDFFTVFMMIAWFMYSTPRDAMETGYSVSLKMLYVGIDLASLLFLLDTFMNFLLNTQRFMKIRNKIPDIESYMRGALAAIAGMIYFHIWRAIK